MNDANKHAKMTPQSFHLSYSDFIIIKELRYLLKLVGKDIVNL